jgi:hypothetical protein
MTNETAQHDFILLQARELGLPIELEDRAELLRVVTEISLSASALRGRKIMMDEPASVFRLEPWID